MPSERARLSRAYIPHPVVHREVELKAGAQWLPVGAERRGGVSEPAEELPPVEGARAVAPVEAAGGGLLVQENVAQGRARALVVVPVHYDQAAGQPALALLRLRHLGGCRQAVRLGGAGGEAAAVLLARVRALCHWDQLGVHPAQCEQQQEQARAEPPPNRGPHADPARLGEIEKRRNQREWRLNGHLGLTASAAARGAAGMNRYKVIKALGDGTYGSVFRAVNRSTGEVVRRAACGHARTCAHARACLLGARVCAPAHGSPERWRSGGAPGRPFSTSAAAGPSPAQPLPARREERSESDMPLTG
jgi:hypothetical protein